MNFVTAVLRCWLPVGALLLGGWNLSAGCVEARSPAAMATYAAGIFRGEVLGAHSGVEADGRIWTHWQIRVQEAFKGTFPDVVRVSAPGGVVDERAEWESTYQWIGPWESAVFMVRANNGFLSLTQGLGVFPERAASAGIRDLGGAAAVIAAIGPETGRGGDFRAFAGETTAGDATLVTTATGFIEDGAGVPARLLWSDRGTRVPVLVDKDSLPAGMSEATALAALQNALDAWAAVSSLSFRIEGYASFGVAAANFDADDGKLRIQLHDNYGYISNGSSTLGIGGRKHTLSAGAGGTVKGLAFHPTTAAYVVMDHDKATLSNAVAYEEVLTHEIGHALGLAHTSESGSEGDTNKREAIMYFQAHNDGRGASLNALDETTIRKGYPTDNTPPFGLDRVVIQVSSGSDITAFGTNDHTLLGGDLQGDALTVELVDEFSGVGSISLLPGNILRFEAGGNFGDNDASGSSFYARAILRFSDGVNLSPTFEVRVRKLRHDGNSDGLADSWVTEKFAGQAAGNRGAADDFDLDGLTNLQEFKWGLDPVVAETIFGLSEVADSGLTFTGIVDVPYALFESDDLGTWRAINLFKADGATTIEFSAAAATGATFYEFRAIE